MIKTAFLSFALLALTFAAAAQKAAQNAPKNPSKRPVSLLERSASALELPLSLWGPYSRTHSGPCFLADRTQGTLFAFPIVVGQRRIETVLRNPAPSGNGKARRQIERVALERRLMGLSPMQAWDDDRPLPTETLNGWNRWSRLWEADSDGALWRVAGTFAPAALAETVLNTPGDDGKMIPAAAWGAGEAVISYFPAITIPGGDGLLIRVSLTNRSPAPQTYFVDLLGGIDAGSPASSLADLVVERESADSENVTIKSKKADVVFALASDATAFPQRSYRVSGGYFSQEGAMSSRSAAGAALPFGLLPDASEPQAEMANHKEAKQAKIKGTWGLLRVDDIAVSPGETVTISLCVGAGKMGGEASDAAQALLAQCDDLLQDGSRRKGDGLATRAANAHRAARFNSGNEAIDRLMAQSLTNIPENNLRRVGVASRRETPSSAAGTYQMENGGWLALGWSGYRQDWSAAQLNACFLTTGPLTLPANPQAAPPINLFALWELYQKTHDRAMLTRVYPYAKRRYREMTAAGQVDVGRALFAWPAPPFRSDLALVGLPGKGPKQEAAEFASRAFAPNYSAYVIRAAKILRLMAEETKQPETDVSQYKRDIVAATSALNETLWDDLNDTYALKAVNGMPLSERDETEIGLLPLIAGSGAVPPARRLILLRRLSDPALFWSDAGIRSMSKAALNYHPTVLSEGAARFGQNWLLWKALLDAGETATAQKLADNLLRAYTAQSPAHHCPEALDGDTGLAFGVPDFTGDSCALIPLYQAYHTPGTVSSGWDLDILSQHYDRSNDTLRMAWHTLNTGQNVPLLCVMGRPNGTYQLSGSLSGLVTSNASGLLTLNSPPESATASLEITPVLK